MTLIVGIKCSDGVVIGADSAATLGSPGGQSTVIEPMTKLEVLEHQIVMAVSGPVGLNQLYCDRIGSLWRDRKLGRELRLAEVMRQVRDAIFEDAQKALAAAAASAPAVGNSLAARSILTHSLIALPVGGPEGRAELIQCDYTGAPEAATTDLPYVSIGSGQPLADPFLAFLRRIFWPGSVPKLADGVFAAVWTLQHSIRVAPGGVSEPIKVATLAKQGKALTPRIFLREELEEQLQNVAEVEKHLASFRDVLQTSSQVLPPQPPSQ